MVFIKMLQTKTALSLLVKCGMTSFSLNFFSNQIQCSHVFLVIQFPESSNLKQSYFTADESRDFPCIPVLRQNFQSDRPFSIRPGPTIGNGVQQLSSEGWILNKIIYSLSKSIHFHLLLDFTIKYRGSKSTK